MRFGIGISEATLFPPRPARTFRCVPGPPMRCASQFGCWDGPQRETARGQLDQRARARVDRAGVDRRIIETTKRKKAVHSSIPDPVAAELRCRVEFGPFGLSRSRRGPFRSL
jgi:hypothetical protein